MYYSSYRSNSPWELKIKYKQNFTSLPNNLDVKIVLNDGTFEDLIVKIKLSEKNKNWLYQFKNVPL